LSSRFDIVSKSVNLEPKVTANYQPELLALHLHKFILLTVLLAIFFVTSLQTLANDNINNFDPKSYNPVLVHQAQEQAELPFILHSVWAYQFGSTDGSDCWGYLAPDGQQYAIMGISTGLVFVNVTTLQMSVKK